MVEVTIHLVSRSRNRNQHCKMSYCQAAACCIRASTQQMQLVLLRAYLHNNIQQTCLVWGLASGVHHLPYNV